MATQSVAATPHMNSSRFYTELVGWYGVVAILFAYTGNMFGWFTVQHPAYLALNITGSLGIVIDAWQQKNWQPVVLNAIWILVAIIGSINVIK